uniref:Uncharacterized protein n=1 Tax=Anguilla anguilla TaxID=7936 RepID=A0A0E9Q4L0_ANGAN
MLIFVPAPGVSIPKINCKQNEIVFCLACLFDEAFSKVSVLNDYLLMSISVIMVMMGLSATKHIPLSTLSEI